MSRRRRRLLTPLVRVATTAAVLTTLHTWWNLRQLRSPSSDPTSVDEQVSVLVPARDEAATIGPCLAAIRGQVAVPSLRVLVLDDRSSDGTDQVVKHHTAADPRLQLIDGDGEPPAGWLGKTWACHQLSEHASGEILVFVDADVVLEPTAIAASVELLRTSGLDLVSPYPLQVAETLAERLVQPLLQWSWLSFLPLAVAERSSRPSLSAANGQFLVVDAAAYERAGGHQSVRGQVVDDVALLAAIKRSGGHGVAVNGTHIATCRMYDGWHDLRAGYTKSLWTAFGSPPGAVAVAAALTVVYVVPIVSALAGSPVGLLGYLAGVTGRWLVADRVQARRWPDVLAHPLSIAAFDWLVVSSVVQHRRGALHWKGRPLP